MSVHDVNDNAMRPPQEFTAEGLWDQAPRSACMGRVSTEVTFGRGDLSVFPLGGLQRGPGIDYP